jgi:hypothetical protein
MIRSTPGGGRIRGRRLPAVVVAWAVVSATATLATVVISPLAGVAVVAIAAIFAVAALGDRPVLCLAVILALVPALVAATTAALAWIAAGSLIAFAIGRDEHLGSDRMDDLRRRISAARRRDERVDVVVFTLAAVDLAGRASFLGSFRLTDSSSVHRVGGGLNEVVMALDHAGLERAGVERRIATQVGMGPRFGWATFPDDGVTLEALLETARRRAHELGWPGPPGQQPSLVGTPKPVGAPKPGSAIAEPAASSTRTPNHVHQQGEFS